MEFIRVMESLITDEERKENGCIDALRVFDSDQRGYISLNELQVALRSMPGSAQMKEFELRDILQEADPDGDGKVKIQGEWISLMIKENVKRHTLVIIFSVWPASCAHCCNCHITLEEYDVIRR